MVQFYNISLLRVDDRSIVLVMCLDKDLRQLTMYNARLFLLKSFSHDPCQSYSYQLLSYLFIYIDQWTEQGVWCELKFFVDLTQLIHQNGLKNCSKEMHWCAVDKLADEKELFSLDFFGHLKMMNNSKVKKERKKERKERRETKSRQGRNQGHADARLF